eukprot:TRINITY_DN2514_c0_g2_i5.p3 TRINITY_DN2514_c0_g2~~TRINITY_DN2514_c0_g2_i5.p3  ORF type:complete len:158 (-),score=20.13 TRINITY_DN2514_c0_g2_i5:53-526(-)
MQKKENTGLGKRYPTPLHIQEKGICNRESSGPIAHLQSTIEALVKETTPEMLMDELYKNEKELYYGLKKKVQDAYIAINDNLVTNKRSLQEDMNDDEVNGGPGEEEEMDQHVERIKDESMDDTFQVFHDQLVKIYSCLLYTSPSPRDGLLSRMPSSA